MRLPFVSSFLTAAAVFGGAAALAFLHPDTPLPPEWNPTVPLSVDAPVTPLTGWKLRQTVANPEACLEVLPSSGVTQLAPLVVSRKCGIDPRVSVARTGETRLDRIETTCAIALRLAMWEKHVLQPEAKARLGASVAEIRHLSSYNCRPIRTPAGESVRMSTHATAEAIDISGFVLSDGRRISLIEDWDNEGKAAGFLRAARDGACRWFRTTLGPEYNDLHADHFHLQSRGWGLCR